MSDEEEKPPFAAALRFLTERERRLLGDHPAPRELAAYHAGELSPEAEARLREHLALCRDCSDLLLDLAGFKKLTPPPGVPELTDEEVEEDWQAVRAKLGGGSTETKVAEVVPIRPAPGIPVMEPSALPWKLMAAALAIVSVSLGLWLMALQRGQGGPAKILDSGSAVRGGEDATLQQVRSNEAGVFQFQSDQPASRYIGEIVEFEGDKVFWRTEFRPSEGVTSSEANGVTVTFVVPADTLEPGNYRALLKGVRNGNRGTIASFKFKVIAP